MTKIVIKAKYSCLFFSEGRKDKKFLQALAELKSFRYATKNWNIVFDNASGSSPKVILESCRKVTTNSGHDIILCFIDLDKLKEDHSGSWEKVKDDLEKEYSKFVIIWHIDSAEEEYRRVVGGESIGKHQLNKLAKKKIAEFIKSNLWKRILEPIKNRETELDSRKISI